MSQARLENLVRARGHIRTKVTKHCNLVSDELSDLTEHKRRTYLDKLESLKRELSDADKIIFQLQAESVATPEDFLRFSDERELYQDKIADALGSLSSHDTRNSTMNFSNNLFSNDSPTLESNKLKLPQVPLPEFSNHKSQNFGKFIQEFEAIVNRHSLSDYVKFVYLCKQLSGAPKILVESLDVDQQKYNVAKELLVKAFDSTLSSKRNLISKLANINLPANADPYSFIGEMRTILSGIRSQNITVDDICQYFIWHGLNDAFQSHLVSITNKSKPNLDEINENIFEATERYLKQLETRKEPKPKSLTPNTLLTKTDDFIESQTNAINVQTNKPKVILCVLCSSDDKKSDHFLKDCNVYVSPKQKFDKLRIIKGCTKCSFKNHQSKDCRFVFKSCCRFCKGEHMSYLCLNPINLQVSQASSTEPADAHATLGSVILSESMQSSINDPILLPTFTAYLKTKDCKIPVRVFKDSGSQRTFICKSIADRLNATVIHDNVNLTIRGFNSNNNFKLNVSNFV